MRSTLTQKNDIGCASSHSLILDRCAHYFSALYRHASPFECVDHRRMWSVRFKGERLGVLAMVGWTWRMNRASPTINGSNWPRQRQTYLGSRLGKARPFLALSLHTVVEDQNYSAHGRIELGRTRSRLFFVGLSGFFASSKAVHRLSGAGTGCRFLQVLQQQVSAAHRFSRSRFSMTQHRRQSL